jgi:recombinational DNA repair protein RecR
MSEEVWKCEACYEFHDNEFSKTCAVCDAERESGDLMLNQSRVEETQK